MLVFNLLTHLVADDYSYLYSYRDRTRIESVASIFPSMAAHYSSMNGRIVAHFLVQLFLLLPHGIFKFLNAGMFALQVYLIYCFANRTAIMEKRHDPFLYCLVFGLIFLFQRAFGQVNLWQDGACNYLWCAVFNLLFLSPYIEDILYDRDLNGRVNRMLFIISGVFIGCYGENASIASIVMIACLLGYGTFVKHHKIKFYQVAAFVAYLIGFAVMMSAPATVNNKFTEFKILVLFKNFYQALTKYYKFRILIAAFTVLFTLGCLKKFDVNKMVLSVIFVIGSLCANFAMMFGGYYEDRSAFIVAIYLVAACAVLFSELKNENKFFHDASVCLGVVVMLFTVYFGMTAFGDIYLTHLEMRQNEMKIVECREAGIMDIQLIEPTPETEYCSVYEQRYLHPTDPKTWPNASMAKYYGVNALTLKPKPEWE